MPPPQIHLVRNLRNAMTTKVVPVGIKQTLLNLAEFMEHEVEVNEDLLVLVFGF